jgi:sporulation protein YlmC with PRC-barrel domain
MRLRELIGTEVMDVDAANGLGQVRSVVLDLDRGSLAALVLDDNRLVDWGEIDQTGGDVLTVHGAHAHETDDNGRAEIDRYEGLLGKNVLLESGRLDGELRDLDIDTDSGTINRVVSTTGEHSGDAILGVGRFALVLADDD